MVIARAVDPSATPAPAPKAAEPATTIVIKCESECECEELEDTLEEMHAELKQIRKLVEALGKRGEGATTPAPKKASTKTSDEAPTAPAAAPSKRPSIH